MDLVVVILTFLLAYGTFMVLAYWLARMMFPKVDVDDPQTRPRKVRSRVEKRLQSRTVR